MRKDPIKDLDPRRDQAHHKVHNLVRVWKQKQIQKQKQRPIENQEHVDFYLSLLCKPIHNV